MTERRNRNRGYMRLRVWNEAIDLYAIVCGILRPLPYDLRRVVSQGVASADSVHRNIAEGYCRKSLNEYLQFLNYALASLGETSSGFMAYRNANQISESDFERYDESAFRLKNGLIALA